MTVPIERMADVDDPVLAAVVEQLTYGLYIVGSRAADGELNGMLADWLMQVSFRPRLLAVALEHSAQTLANLRATGIFSVNLLAEDPGGMALAQQFAQPYADAKIGGRYRARVHPKVGTVAHTQSPHGCPVLAAAIA